MGFDTLLGNERLKENLENSLKKGHISHFYLISGPKGSGKHTLARLLAAAAWCEGQDKPCLTCRSCRKVMAGVHPDFITVDDPEKKTVPVDLIRSAREDMFILPNEGKRKIYLFPECALLDVKAQNVLLKVVEDAPARSTFIFCAENPAQLLPTIRSRCTCWMLGEVEEGGQPQGGLRPHPAQRFHAVGVHIIAVVGGFLVKAHRRGELRDDLADRLREVQ